MDVIITFLIDHKEWLFSGVGIVTITSIFRMIFRKKHTESNQKIQAGNGSTNIQSGGDVSINIDKRTNSNDVE